MTQVYIVSDGYYSDYHIIGVFSSRDKAEEARTLYDTNNTVEIYDLDSMPEHPVGHWPWEVSMNTEGNSTAWRANIIWFKGGWTFNAHPYPAVQFSIWARDKRHAVKIANEKRAMLIASGEWPQESKV